MAGMRRYEPWLVNAMALLSVFVQLAVYGATKIRSHGALLSEWTPYFGAPYGLAFLALQIWYCLSCRHRRALIHIAVAWLSVLAVSVWAHATGRHQFRFGEFTALASGLSALALWAGFHSGRI